jgi:hypothetical protein
MNLASAHGFPPVAEPWASILIGVIAVVVIVWISVVVRIIRNIVRSDLDTGMKVVWVCFILSSQPLGVILWLTIGRRRRPSQLAL